MEQDMLTLKSKLADAKIKLKGLHRGHDPKAVAAEPKEQLTPGEKRIRRAMNRFDRLQTQVENLEARVRSYEVGGPSISVWDSAAETKLDPLVEKELESLKQRISGTSDVPEVESSQDSEQSVETEGEA